MKTVLRFKTTPKKRVFPINEDNHKLEYVLQNENSPVKEDNPKNEDSPKNEDNHKKGDDPKYEEDSKSEDDPQMKITLQI